MLQKTREQEERDRELEAKHEALWAKGCPLCDPEMRSVQNNGERYERPQHWLCPLTRCCALL